MRLLSIVTAIAVVAVLYFLIIERDSLLGFAGVEPENTSAVQESEAEDGMSESNAVSVVVLRSQARTVDGAVILRGRTEAVRQVELRAETSGRVVGEPLRKGLFVDENDLMCRLDPGTRQIALDDANARLLEAKARLPESQARQAEAEARLAEAEINDRAASRLSEGGFASDTRVAQTTAGVEAARAGVQAAKSGVESARSGIQSAEAAVAAAIDELGKLEINAPFAGLLESDTAELGALMQPGSLCATIIQLNPIRVVGFVPETMVDRVEVGAAAGARLSSGQEVLGTVTFISRSADPTTRTFRVDIEVPNPDLAIRDGQTAEIGIQAQGETAHLVPQSSLTLNDEGTLGLRTVENEIAQFSPVGVIRDSTKGVWVSGLPQDVDIIVVGQEYVTEGVPVAVTYREAAE